jgi:hypothetical protein
VTSFFRKQGEYVLQQERYAILLVALLVLFPFAAWISVAVMALVTLRKGLYDGFKLVLVGMLTTFVGMKLGLLSTFSASPVLLIYPICFGAAYFLRVTASWNILASMMLLLALLVILIIHWLAPDYILKQYDILVAMLRKIDKGGPVAQFLIDQQGGNRVIWANYTLGIRAFSMTCSVLSSLILARYVQSILYYPGGLRIEMLSFRANVIGLVFLIISALGSYQDNSLAVSCLPLLVAYFTAAGLSLICQVMTPKKGLVMVLLIFVPLIFVPYIMVPVYVILGSLDSLINFRKRLPSKADDTRK